MFHLLHINSYFIAKNNFVVEVTFNTHAILKRRSCLTLGLTWRRGHRGGGSTLIRFFPTGWGVGEGVPHQLKICSFPHLEKLSPLDFYPPQWEDFGAPPKVDPPHLKFSSYNPIKTAFLAVVMAASFLFFFHTLIWFPSLGSPLTPYCYFENPACAHNFRTSPSFVTPLNYLAFSFLHTPNLSLIMNHTLTKL